MEFRNLITFDMVVERESFTKAAEELGYAQSTVTSQIKQLEMELGVPIFDRLGNQIRLTEPGRILHGYAKQIISLAEEAKHAVICDTIPSGKLRVAGISSLCAAILPQMIRQYNEKFPDVTIMADTMTTAQVMESVSAGRADIGLYMDFDQNIPADFCGITMDNPLYFISAPGHLLTKRKKLSIKELEGIPIIGTEIQCCYRKMLVDLFARHNLVPSVLFETENTEVIKHFVQSGIGISFLPEIAVREEIREMKLCRLPVTDLVPVVYLHIIHGRNQWMSPAVREFFALAEIIKSL